MEGNIKTTTMRIEESLYALLVKQAEKDRRSVNQQVLVYIKQGLNKSIAESNSMDIAKTAETA